MDEAKPFKWQRPTAEHREPCDSRGSCTVLGAPGGGIPPGDSTFRAWSIRHPRSAHVRFAPKADKCIDASARRYHSITPVGEILKRWLDGAVSHKQQCSKRRRRRGRQRAPRRTRAALL